MAPRREILDSEDEGSDFGDGAGVGDVGVPDEAEMPRDDPLKIVEASHKPGTDSTDPSFFQRIYEQQQAAVHAQDVIPDTAPAGPSALNWTQLSSAPPPAQKPQLKDHSSLSSMTDPLPTSRKSKRAYETSQSDVIDLTETPRKDAANSGSDVWDVPTSARSQGSTRTYGKRKLAQLSLEQELTPNAMPDTQDPYAFPDATPPTKKKIGRDQPRSPTQRPPDSSPVMLVPTQDATSSDRRTRSTRKKKGGFEVESSMPDTAAPSLYITQSTLTASQKREYRTVSLSSEAMPEVSEMLPPDQIFGTGEVYKSSGATTIAYPTPSRVASSRRLPEITEEMDGSVAGTSLVVDADHQQSSPDVLTDMTTSTASRAKRSRIKIVSSAAGTSSELEPPPSARRTKKRRVVREAEDDSWDRDPLGSTQENIEPLPQNTSDQGAPADANDSVAQPEAPTHKPRQTEVDALDAPNPPSNPPPKNKRGRKKKDPKPTPDLREPPPEAPALEPLAEPTDPTDIPEPPTKRKRGRPRKADTPSTKPQAEPIVIDYEPEQDTPHNHHQPLSETNPNSQPSRAPEDSVPLCVTGADEGKENGGLEVVAAAKDDAPVRKTEGKGTEREIDKETEKEKQPAAGKDGKAGGGAGQKVQYRVGLSKRSRIAPLLKCLKK